MKQDIYNHEQRYRNWKNRVLEKGDPGLSKKNSDLLLQFIFDMEVGANVSVKSKRGARSYHRLNAVKQKLSRIFRYLQTRKITDVTKVTDKQIQELFNDMRSGKLKSERGEKYKSTADYVKGFKAFWHWWQKVNAKDGKTIPDITEYLDSRREEKPVWVYLSESQMSMLLSEVSATYQPLLEFIYDSGARVTEALSLRVMDVEEKERVVYVNISQEISKSIGRKIKLLLCGRNLLKYIQQNNLKPKDLLFPLSSDDKTKSLSAPYINRYLNALGKRLFGDETSRGGEMYSKLTLYDFRHNSCCYWLPKYKTSAALMYRFGWKSEKYIHYYSEFLGLKDSIEEKDLYEDITKTELDRKLEESQKQIEALKQMIIEDREIIHSIKVPLTESNSKKVKYYAKRWEITEEEAFQKMLDEAHIKNNLEDVR